LVALLKEVIVSKLPSLRDKDLSTLTLHAAADRTAQELGPAQDSTDSVEEALHFGGVRKTDKIRIVVKVAGVVAPAAASTPQSGAQLTSWCATWRALPRGAATLVVPD
jgi:hypothetical protein